MFGLSDIKLTRDQRVAITNLIQTIFIFINNNLVTDKVYNTVQLIQHMGMKNMHFINFVNFALLLSIFLNKWQYRGSSFQMQKMVLFRLIRTDS